MNHPVVSVLMTAYNRESYIASAIESVLGSSFPDFELVIVDDGSSDDTVNIAQKYAQLDSRIKIYINPENLGDYPNRNRAASFAKGKYLKYLDSDDLIYPWGLQIMVQSMESFPQAGFGLSSIPDKNHVYPQCLSPREAYIEHFERFGHFNRSPGSAIIRRDAFEIVGGFSGKRMIGDNELWFSLARSFDMVKIPRDLIWHRSHEEQESKSDYANKYNKLRIEAITTALNHPHCPLNNEEKDLYVKKIKQKRTRDRVFKFYRKVIGKSM